MLVVVDSIAAVETYLETTHNQTTVSPNSGACNSKGVEAIWCV